MGNVDLGRTIYLGLPYYGRWLLAVVRVLAEKHHIGLTELAERMAEVKARFAGGLRGKSLEAEPKFEGDPATVKRNRHHTHAVGKGDPQVFAGQAGHPKFKVGDKVVVRELPVLLYTRTQEYVRGATGEIAVVSSKARPPRTRHGMGRTRNPSGSILCDSICLSCGTTTPAPAGTHCRPKSPSGGSRDGRHDHRRPTTTTTTTTVRPHPRSTRSPTSKSLRSRFANYA